jgi:DNA repair protein RecO (recombination protein O)
VQAGALKKADRIRFSPIAVKEGSRLLEAFVPFHLGKEPKSLRFLRQIRGS